jgi:hypothetical protein
MGDLIFVVVIVAFFAVTVAYVRACERIVGRDTDSDTDSDTGGGREAAELAGADVVAVERANGAR